MSEHNLYPVFLKLAQKPVLLVGAGPVAASKLAGLLAADAKVTIVSPQLSEDMRQQDLSEVRILQKPFEAEDLDGVWFVVAAAFPEVNRQVKAEADARQIFVNAADDKAAATAYLPGVVRRDDVTLAISTGGSAPALAGLLREGFAAMLPEDLKDWQDEALRLRAQWKASKQPPPMEARRPALLRAINKLYEDRNGATDE